MDYQYLDSSRLKAWFERFAERECSGVSPFYEHLARAIAEDDALLQLAAHCRQGQPMPNLFLASVHFLLLGNSDHPLTAYYPSLNGFENKALPFALFKEFCLSHAQEIITLQQTKIVQTNAINRTAYLLPIIFSLFERGISINIVDIGASAGLNLNFDQYAYQYINGKRFGRSPVIIESEIRGGKLPKIEPAIRINRKTGVDQNPLDLHLEENARWLQALIWPDRKNRFERMEQAIALAKRVDIHLVQGYSAEDFKTILLQQEKDLPLVVYHTHVLYQFTAEGRTQFRQMLDEIGSERDLYYLAAEAASILPYDYGMSGILVELTTYKQGTKNSRLMARTNGHASWIDWI